jgi:hypothetical protein
MRLAIIGVVTVAAAFAADVQAASAVNYESFFQEPLWFAEAVRAVELRL